MKKLLTGAIALAALGAACMQPAGAASLKVEHTFCAKTNCTDGATPADALTPDGNGNYFGTTGMGGDDNDGTVFMASNNAGHWTFTRIYSFCPKADCTKGSSPDGGVIIDVNGNLYGTTTKGGSNDGGVVYEMSHTSGKWVYRVLYAFCPVAGCIDGSGLGFETLSYQGAASGAPYDGTSPLFGTTNQGGGVNAGTIFELVKKGTKWSEKVIYSFCSESNCADGGTPFGGATVDAQGNIFGVNTRGGNSSSDTCCGVFYELKPNGKNWTFVRLYAFCSDISSGICKDGSLAMATPVMDAEGNFYGTTLNGGGKKNAGIIYKLTPSGTHSKLTVLYSFCAKANCSDGAGSFATPLIMDDKGTLYGVTDSGGHANDGIVFSLGGTQLDHLEVLAGFKGTNGSHPIGGLTLDASGALFGTTTDGGKNNGGTFYQVTP